MELRFGSLPLRGSQNCAAVLVGASHQTQPGAVRSVHGIFLKIPHTFFPVWLSHSFDMMVTNLDRPIATE